MSSVYLIQLQFSQLIQFWFNPPASQDKLIRQARLNQLLLELSSRAKPELNQQLNLILANGLAEDTLGNIHSFAASLIDCCLFNSFWID